MRKSLKSKTMPKQNHCKPQNTDNRRATLLASLFKDLQQLTYLHPLSTFYIVPSEQPLTLSRK